METRTSAPVKASHGYNVRRMREILGVKQDALAVALNMTQQNFSKLEQKAEIEEDLLAKIADALQVPIEAIKNYDDKGVVNIISNSFADNSGTAVAVCHSVNPIDKVAELYERMMKEKDGQIELLKNLLERK
jgi:transcriptional regulator with XRE-family HTH domain